MDPSPPPPPSNVAPSPQVVREVHYYQSSPSPGTAIVLEILLGMFVQTFGVGNLYAGNTAGGLLMMFGYWGIQVINFILCFLIIGIFLLPLTWLAFMIFCPIIASSSAKRRAYEAMMQQQMMQQHMVAPPGMQ